jgi:D-galactonate transporter
MQNNNKASSIRWWIAGLMWTAIAINYIDRVVLSAAAPFIAQEYALSTTEMGLVMSAFFWSYALLQLPAGWLADRFGQKITLGGAVLWWSAATALTGVATGFKSLFALRIGLGIGEAAAYPSNAGIASRWFPDKERATVSGIFDSGSKFGGAIAMPLIVWLIAGVGWKMTFVLSGGIGIVWALVWFAFYKNDPERHPRVNAAELQYIRAGQRRQESDGDKPTMRWYDLLRYRNVWAMCLGFFFINYNSYFFITWLPTYLVKERGMDLISMGFMAALPLLVAMVVEVFAGWLSDRIYQRGHWSLTRIRKTFLVVGLLMASCIGFAAFAESAWVAIVLLCIAKSGTTVAATQVWAMPGDIAPRGMTSMLAGLQNTVSNMGGVVGPIITGMIVTLTGSFVPALLFSAALIVVAIANYLFLLGDIKPIEERGTTAVTKPVVAS